MALAEGKIFRSGKTLAFGLPALHHIQTILAASPEKKSKKSAPMVSVLVLAPTRELAMQTDVTLSELGGPLGIASICIYGGVPKPPQIEALKQSKTRIVVGTPGRIIDLANDGALDLSAVSYLVLDEADRMLDRGFENDIRTIIGQCRSLEQRHTMMFSATWPVSVRKLANDFMRQEGEKGMVRITVGSDELTASASVEQKVLVLSDNRMKDAELLKALASYGITKTVNKGQGQGVERAKALVFALYKKEASRVESFLKKNGWEVSCIQGWSRVRCP